MISIDTQVNIGDTVVYVGPVTSVMNNGDVGEVIQADGETLLIEWDHSTGWPLMNAHRDHLSLVKIL